METLSFYDLRHVLKTFLTSFSMSLETLNFHESPHVMETETASFPMYSCTEDFEFLEFPFIQGTLNFYDSPLYWRLCFLRVFPCIEDFEFLQTFPL